MSAIFNQDKVMNIKSRNIDIFEITFNKILFSILRLIGVIFYILPKDDLIRFFLGDRVNIIFPNGYGKKDLIKFLYPKILFRLRNIKYDVNR